MSKHIQELLADASGFFEIWQMWAGLFPEIPIWDPYLAVFFLIFLTSLITFFIMSLFGGRT